MTPSPTLERPPSATSTSLALPETAVELGRNFEAAKKELSNVIVGMESILSAALIGAITSSHVLLQGAPGLAKTLLAKNIAKVLGLSFARQQFTTDLMPADITGSLILPTGATEYSFVPGPVFANVFMADEINRTPPKTQSALLESMEEEQVTVGGISHPLPKPFFVIATQNEINTPGTFPLPLAQLDRFAMKLEVPLPTAQQLVKIGELTTGSKSHTITPVLSENADQTILNYRKEILKVCLTSEIEMSIAKLVLSLCPGNAESLDTVNRMIESGPMVRAMQSLIILAKANAILSGRLIVTPEDIKKYAVQTLSHRLVVKPLASNARKLSLSDLVQEALENVFPK